MKVLSTKKLNESQKNLLGDLELKEIPFISISYGENFKVEETILNAVFTSANSVRSVFKKHEVDTKWFDTVFCVGQKTKKLLEENGIAVEICANNALDLADILAEKFSSNDYELNEISWFCGNLRNNDLPTILAENGVVVTEYLVYQTKLTPVEIKEDFDAVLFFSPSGVKSYLKKNKVNSKPVICIGSTTATEAIESFENVYIAEETSVESTIDKVKEVLL